MKVDIQNKDKIQDRILFNFLAYDRTNTEEILEASRGFAVPGITASDFDDLQLAAARVKDMKEVSPVVSIGLGGNGDTTMWQRVLAIALASDPGHINQPFERSAYVRGVLDHARKPQFINALVSPTGKVGIVQLASGIEMEVDQFVALAKSQGIESIKVMPVKGLQHLQELVEIARVAARQGIYGIEPAGGIDASNIKQIVTEVMQTDISFFMPHIFGSTIDSATKRTIPKKVKEIVGQII